jgi:hypothetical protein
MTCGPGPRVIGRTFWCTPGDFAYGALGRKRGTSPFKKRSTPRVEVMPCSSCILRALSPSGPLDGARRCSLEGNASEPSPLVVPSLESLRSQLGCRSCLPFAAVRGAQPHGGRCSSVITQLQGFSSCIPAAVPHQWPSRRMTTSLTLGRSKPSCGFPPQPQLQGCSSSLLGQGASQVGPCPLRGLVTRFFLQHSEEKGVHQPCRGDKPWLHRASRLQAISCSVSGPLGWTASAPPLTLPPAALAGAWMSIHRTGDGCAVCGSGTSTPSPAYRPH